MLVAFLLSLITAGILGMEFYNKTRPILLDNALKEIGDEIHRESFQFKYEIEILYQNLLALSRTPPIQGII